MLRRIAAAVALTASVAAPLTAQSLEQVCQSIRQMKVGQWVEWRMSGGPQGQPDSVRMAVVGTDQRAGKTYYWVEISMTNTQMGKMIIQDLVPGFPFQPADVQAIVMKRGDEPAMRMPEQMLEMIRSRTPRTPGMDMAENCGKAKVIGWESVSVPAGTFKTLHLQDTTMADSGKTGDVWVTPDVGFGLIKASSADGSVELLAKGTDAKSQITETPQEMPMGPGR